MKISKDPQVNWRNNAIQFPRLIAEMEVAGAFTPSVIQRIGEEMDIEDEHVAQLIERAQAEWGKIARAAWKIANPKRGK